MQKLAQGVRIQNRPQNRADPLPTNSASSTRDDPSLLAFVRRSSSSRAIAINNSRTPVPVTAEIA
jgi:hypothetical protein